MLDATKSTTLGHMVYPQGNTLESGAFLQAVSALGLRGLHTCVLFIFCIGGSSLLAMNASLDYPMG